jgi:hypothetical protein
LELERAIDAGMTVFTLGTVNTLGTVKTADDRLPLVPALEP